MTPLPDPDPFKPRHSKLGITILLSIALIAGLGLTYLFKALVKHGQQMEQEIESGDAPLWSDDL